MSRGQRGNRAKDREGQDRGWTKEVQVLLKVELPSEAAYLKQD